MMHNSTERPILIGRYIVKSGATVRNAAKIFGVSKSTVHKDVTDRLKGLSKSLWQDVQAVLQLNKQERHIRGGNATKQKYKKC